MAWALWKFSGQGPGHAEGRTGSLLALSLKGDRTPKQAFHLSLTTASSSHTLSLLPGNPGLHSLLLSCVCTSLDHRRGPRDKFHLLTRGARKMAPGPEKDLPTHERSSSLASEEGKAGSPGHGGLEESLFRRNNQELKAPQD